MNQFLLCDLRKVTLPSRAKGDAPPRSVPTAQMRTNATRVESEDMVRASKDIWISYCSRSISSGRLSSGFYP